MNRINKKGLQLVQYKEEMGKDYPQIVKESLMLGVQQLLENEIIDLDTFEAVKDDALNKEAFESYLLTKPGLSKTMEEMLEEFEVIRKGLDLQLQESGLLDIATESIIEKDIILVSKRFCIEEKFVMSYFGVEEKDLIKLMKRRGFIEKFAVLRLSVIIEDIVNRVSSSEGLFTTNASLVYFNKDDEGYSVDLEFEIPIETLEVGEQIVPIIEKIEQIKTEAEMMYKEKTIV